MKNLLSLPHNLVNCFHEIEHVSPENWFCTSDPVGKRLGSGGGTTWLLEACYRDEASPLQFEEWLAKEKRILLHAGGQSRRLPAYAPSGKILTPIPVFRWERGQRLNQSLLSLQLPLYEEIMQKAPDSFHTLIASGDVYIRANEPLQCIPEADVVCYGLWVDPVLATRHGVFMSSRENPSALDFMMQKPSIDLLGEMAQTHLFLMDIGIWLLSDKAVELLVKHSYESDGQSLKMYDLYSEFGLALGQNPRIKDTELNQLSVAILPLPGGEFYHYGTGSELISSTLAVQNLVRDQRAIMQRKVKPHPAMFVQNAEVEIPLRSDNFELWIENSFIAKDWKITNKHILTGIPKNNWSLKLPAGICVDVVPLGDTAYVARPYGFTDMFRGKASEPDTMFMEQPLQQWLTDRYLDLPENDDIQDLLLFPVCDSIEDMGEMLNWMIANPENEAGRELWQKAPKMSAAQLTDEANLLRLTAQRKSFRQKNWPTLAENHERSIFYQLDLADAALAFAQDAIPLPAPLSKDMPVIKQIHDRMFRSRVFQIQKKNEEAARAESEAFSLLRDGMIVSMECKRQTPHLDVYQDQIVWGRSPVRIDLAGGWTDTPPYCLYVGGNVVNVAVELNGQPPLQVYVKPCREFKIILRSIDLGDREELHTWEDLKNYNKVGSPFSIPKAALSLAGFIPEYSLETYASLEAQLKEFGSGIELTLLSAVPAGSGLGTSSILAATVLAAVSDFCGLGWDKSLIGDRTLVLEQLLTTGGGWQDQYGGILHGVKLLQTQEGFRQSPLVRWLPDYFFTDPQYQSCHLLYYTGITRTAKGILAEIVRGMFLNEGYRLRLLSEMKTHALDLYDAVQYGSFETYGRLIGKTWEQKKAIDPGTNPPAVEALISLIKDYALGYELPGAGGGGYLYIIAKDPEAAGHIRRILTASALHPNARFVDMKLSTGGLQVSRS
ncbi:galactokinase/mevalonate kinase-like predicted kinase [Parabacteroides sp. PF5-5]|nr:galactokinase/mevalonate kinase-like predicted kinase [Parabacteroides sp. PH5-39]MDH6317800.1 galactokinase/mevalonate kinase-like predicted kinase [Parabacteroides sp. PF5-13]MDH6321544.1 galactokinase/mevalonate kinase-like predicted kinase [Parabacteroides sp. PH5-13]MDH6325326.1 galactokinase/mevalonate kinase-like predicted kinase [Parabacteroides sp. PH5-8]MDH6328997.1 galactokinase/mevalonate kinase-like predicted kinase [Parabacteroides sp. PH5-41]MDH6336787.1 galactokinase/mevalon